MRPSIKYIVWLGAHNCYRNQDAIVWEMAYETKRKITTLSERAHASRYSKSGLSMVDHRARDYAFMRGGSTPFNVIPMGNADEDGHGASTPYALVDWAIRYLTKPGDVVADWCMGSGTAGHACGNLARRFVGIEKDASYFKIAEERIATAYEPLRHMQQVAV